MPATSTEPAAYSSRLSTNAGSLRQAANSPSSKPFRVTRLRYSAGMIWSVSTLLRRRGTPTPVWTVNFSIASDPRALGQVGRRRQPSGDGGGRRDERRDQMRTATSTLASLEVAVRRRRAALTAAQLIGVHPQAHRTARRPPFGSRC